MQASSQWVFFLVLLVVLLVAVGHILACERSAGGAAPRGSGVLGGCEPPRGQTASITDFIVETQ